MAQPRVAVVGGGIAGTLCSLVLKNRGVHPTILDAGKSGLGGRLRGAPFLRAADPKLAVVCSMLEREGLLTRWEGRFGVLGSSGGGFLPAEVITATGLGGMNKANEEGGDNTSTVGGRSAASDGGDFCHFADGSKVPTYVGVPSMADLCPSICKFAGIEEAGDARVVSAMLSSEGGWNVNVQGGDGTVKEESFDGLVLATQDSSFSSGIVRSIVDAEVAAGGYASVEDASADNDSVVVRLLGLADALQIVRDDGRMSVYTIKARYPKGFSQSVPFDAASVPGSNLVQFLLRDASRPNSGSEETEGETWTAISTSQYAAKLLSRPGLSDGERLSEVSAVLPEEIGQLLSSFHGGDAPQPLKVSAKRWGAAFTSIGLGLKEDSVALAPWRLAICGDYVRDMSSYKTPLEAAALSGLEAGERTASFFQQQETSPAKQ